MRLDHAQINIQTTHQEDYAGGIARTCSTGVQLDDFETETLVDSSPAFPLCRYLQNRTS